MKFLIQFHQVKYVVNIRKSEFPQIFYEIDRPLLPTNESHNSEQSKEIKTQTSINIINSRKSMSQLTQCASMFKNVSDQITSWIIKVIRK